jgi:predicted phosphodiesterase
VRYGVLSDVHGNLFALRAAVDRLRRAGVDGWLCAGDVVGYGPQPNECVDLLAELGARCVAGNHELLVLDRLPADRAGRLARETTPWTRSALREDTRAWLAALPLTVRVPGLTMAHGSLDDPQRYVTQPARAAEELRQAGTRLLVLGHTHRPWLFHAAEGTLPLAPGAVTALPPTGRLLVNPGSVGQSRQREWRPRARFLLLDVDRGEVELFAEPYDVDAARAALRAHGLPGACIHVPPGRLRAVPRRAAALLRATGLRYARRRTEV